MTRFRRIGREGRVELGGAWGPREAERLAVLLAVPGLRAVVLDGLATLDAASARALDGALAGVAVPLVAIARGDPGPHAAGILARCVAHVLPGELDAAVAELLGDRSARVVRAVTAALRRDPSAPRREAFATEAGLFLDLLTWRPGPVRTAVVRVALGECDGAGELSPGEAEGSSRPRARAVAGAIALKRAVLAVYGEVVPGLRALDVGVAHLDDGTPVLARLPGPGGVYVSVSHGEGCAVAAAAWQARP